MPKSQNAFTLVELLIVVIILGFIAAFGIPSYTKSRARTVEKDAAYNLGVIAEAMEMFKIRNDEQYTLGSTLDNVGEINATLSLGIIEQDMVYSCTGNGTIFTCTANPSDYTWNVEVSDTDAGTPVCAAGPACPTL